MSAIPEQYLPPPVPDSTALSTTVDLQAVLASEWARDRLITIAANTPRSKQAEIGPSEIGQACPRRLAYRIAGTPVVNLPDPLKAMFGTGMHAVIAEGLRALDGSAAGRYLIEALVTYRGIVGHVDLFDRFSHRLFDWKTTMLNRIRKYQTSGVPPNSAVQAWIYAEALREAGEDVRTIAITYIPRDGDTHDLWTWTTTPNKDKADLWVDRYLNLMGRIEDGTQPGDVEAVPSALCPWCPNYRPSSTDLSIACPGKEQP